MLCKVQVEWVRAHILVFGPAKQWPHATPFDQPRPLKLGKHGMVSPPKKDPTLPQPRTSNSLYIICSKKRVHIV
jgi:hypothetical protein